ncbi:MBOAT, membrane-bound O-acyltransferase family-domain-containing protein [Cristinia sonorae]|uniref:MBOAT, membrane-bound O-acyltransferase family-domain-containing protein n=1 Tax=Cristinia sonorae TaxID=1940300 RepID=A0A8K0UIZ7_9AGAR|nr:MBOAT, membrane-bound O-acyltransferase family-domain-containing protein [Cristinia sonorae]
MTRLGSVSLEMPTDLRGPRVEPLHLQPTTPKQRGITRLTVDIPDATKPSSLSSRPSRWRTPEFVVYGVVFLVVVPLMVWIPVSLSSTSHANYPVYHRKLSPGWLFGRQVDNSDHQYRTFRNNVPVLTLLVTIFLGSKAAYTFFVPQHATRYQTGSHLIPFFLTFSLILLSALHGISILKILAIISLNYYIAKNTAASKFGPILTWTFNICVLFANEWFSGYQFAAIHPSLNYLDNLSGILPRWHINFNISMLRLIAFNMDYYWARNQSGTVDNREELNHKQRTRTSHPLELYSYQNYVAYILYPPLYLAGPIMTFNDFLWQLRRPTQRDLRGLLGYFVRFLVCVLTLEFILHFMYMMAIKDTRAWDGNSAAEIGMIGFWNLAIVWLKLLVPWRFFRLWALADGIDPPENMVRCVANNYSVLGFWRAWHRSYNLWIVRYIYIPLGGTNNVILTTILVFTFVALWHDLSFKLLIWGWLASLFFIPELTARYLLPARKFGDKPWYRHVCAVGAVGNLLMLMTANLVGFVIGIDGVGYMISKLFSGWDGIRFLGTACLCLFIAVQVMFEYREEEMRKGIYRRC